MLFGHFKGNEQASHILILTEWTDDWNVIVIMAQNH